MVPRIHPSRRPFTREPVAAVGVDSKDNVYVFSAERVETINDHGTGCSLSAAICAGLALGKSVPDATREAKAFVLKALNGAADWKLGRGRGPIDHLGWDR